MCLIRFFQREAALLIGVAAAFSSYCASGQTAGKELSAHPILKLLGIAKTPERRPSPSFRGVGLPDPPAQNKPWSEPASDLPESFVTATKALFEHGMADPRGCEYREIEIATGSVWSGDNGVVSTHGWVLPGSGPQRFAICWNGLVYPAVSVGAPAYWGVDARGAMDHAYQYDSLVQPEDASVSWETSLPVKGCLILRLGDAKLAGEFWKSIQLAGHLANLRWWEGYKGTDRGPKPEFAFDKHDPYLNWAGSWEWSLYDRAVCAHMRGDDGLALLSARGVERIRPLIEREAEHRGIKRPFSSTSGGNEILVPYFGFLDPVRALFKDQVRRASASKQPAALEVVNDPAATQSQRIEALIRDLDQVAVRQGGQPVGPFNVTDDPVVAALIREGAPAIAPLLRLFESEAASQLTRSVTFSRAFHADRELHTLTMPVRAVLLMLMKTTAEAVGVTRKDRSKGKLTAKGEAARLRAWWLRYGAVPEADRWYRTLADDAAGKVAWTDAAEHLVRRNTDRSLVGESLRSKTNPTVSELLVKRAEGFVRVRRKWRGSFEGFHDGDASRFIQTSMKWESVPLLPVARELMGNIMGYYDPNSKRGRPSKSDGRIMAELTVARAVHGDKGAVEEWAGWISGRTPDDLGDYPGEAFEPFWRFHDRPEVLSVSHKLFGGAGSPWAALLDPAGRQWGMLFRGKFEMLLLPEVRMRWLELLTNRQVVGTATMERGGDRRTEITGVSSGTRGPGYDREGITVGTQVKLRTCDVVADCLSEIQGFPGFSFFWSEADRDRSIAGFAGLLKTKGGRLRAFAPESPGFFKPAVRFEFPPRERPASRADVENGDAIFHLEDLGRSEIVSMPRVPATARTKTEKPETVMVWQTEQIRNQGKVQLFYGIVAPHRIMRVTADEIEFVPEANAP